MKEQLIHLASCYPVVTIMGPRQSGKTTLAKATFPDKDYVNLEAPDLREMADFDPRGFLERFPDGAILDETQNVPKLLSYIQTIVDEKNVKGLFILTGSHQVSLHEGISQSLAGRTALLTLLPLSLRELQQNKKEKNSTKHYYLGGIPVFIKTPSIQHRLTETISVPMWKEIYNNLYMLKILCNSNGLLNFAQGESDKC